MIVTPRLPRQSPCDHWDADPFYSQPGANLKREDRAAGEKDLWQLARTRSIALEFTEAAEEASAHDWDGEGGLPLDDRARFFAEQIVLDLPAWAPRPNVAASNVGDILLQWTNGSVARLSAKVRRDGKVTFAYLSPSKDLTYGTTDLFEFVSKTLPQLEELQTERNQKAGVPRC